MYSVLHSLAHASARAAIHLTFPTSPAGARELSCTPAAAIAAEAKELSVLHDLIEVANLVQPLMNPWAEMTIFAPSNNAFDDLAGADPVAVLATNRVALEAVLTLHIVDGAFTTADLYDGQVLETAAGAELTVEVHDTHIDIVAPGDDGTIGTIQIGDVDACGSVLHMLDAVLVPGADVVVATGPPTNLGQERAELIEEDEPHFEKVQSAAADALGTGAHLPVFTAVVAPPASAPRTLHSPSAVCMVQY